MATAKGRLGAALAVLLAVAGLVGFSIGAPAIVTGADTDVPHDTIDLTTDDTTVDVGGSVDLTAVLTDSNGDPVAGADCTLSISSQPGSDASLDSTSATTDANGALTVTLDVGSSEGTVKVIAECDGGLTATVSVVAGAAEPPASLPETGTGFIGTSGDSGISTLLIALMAMFGAMLIGAGFVATRRVWQTKEN